MAENSAEFNHLIIVLALTRRVGFYGLLTLVLSACQFATLLDPAGGEPTPGIVFVTNRHVDRNQVGLHSNWELYLVQPDGTGLTRLTDNERVDTSPSWSPDGRQIAFRSREDGSSDIFVMNADGSRWRNLVRDPADSIYDEFFPEWNPQRELIALYTDRFYSPAVGCAWHRVAIMPLAGGKDEIVVLAEPLTEQETLGWHPDGRHLAFSSRCDFGKEQAVELFMWDIDTNEVTQITDDGYINADPAFSPDGRYLAYQSVRDGQGADIIVLDMETGEERNLTNSPAKDSHPTWSPDGRQIAFASDRDGNDDIFVMNADGSDPRNITNHPAKDWEPDWSPVP